jgi:hypothetical protein
MMKKKLLKVVEKFTETVSHLDLFHSSLARHLVIELTRERLIHPADEISAQEVIIKAMKGSTYVEEKIN